MPDPAGPDPAPRREATLREVLSAVAWSFFGVRKGRHMHRDAVSMRPHQVIVAGLVVAAVLVIALIVAVRLIVRAAG